MMKKLILILLLLQATLAHAQVWEGTYQTQYGPVKLVYEDGMYYGDYAGGGTVIAFEHYHQSFELHGLFFNGNARGKFIWSFSTNGNLNVQGFMGYYAYDNTTTLADIRKKGNSYRSDFQTTKAEYSWSGKRTSTAKVTDLQTAVWNGKWPSNFGELTLEQVGNQVTGKYSTLGDIKGTYDKTGKKLKGTFTNKGRTGYMEWTFEGNSFTGKWGWDSRMGEDKPWTSTKTVKSNKAVPKPAAAPASTAVPAGATKKIKVHIGSIIAQDISHVRDPELYGFAGVKLYRVTSSGREEIKSFGNKPANFFDRTENNPFPQDKRYAYRVDFAASPEYVREFTINAQDLNNPNVDIEIEIWHHIKGKVIGPNADMGYHKEVMNIEQIQFENGSVLRVGSGYRNGKSLTATSSKSHAIIYLTGL